MNAVECRPERLVETNRYLAGLKAGARVAWALERLPATHVLSSSFGVQAAAMLHLVTRFAPATPVIFVDTGYLFPETYRFADELTTCLQLNLKVYRAEPSPAWQEARFGKLWEQGDGGLNRYNRLNKVEPMRRALEELDAWTWFAGLRRVQSAGRARIPFLDCRDGRYRCYPLADWSERDLWLYLRRHDLPYHPLWYEGYVSVGDVHTTRRLEAGMTAEKTRFFGRRRECGIHTEL